MDIKDFEGLTKFKVIIPSIYIFSWLTMLTGPVFFDYVYSRFCIFFLIYTNVKVLILITIMIIATVKSSRIFKRIREKPKTRDRELFDKAEEIYYGFIIPNYKEEV